MNTTMDENATEASDIASNTTEDTGATDSGGNQTEAGSDEQDTKITTSDDNSTSIPA